MTTPSTLIETYWQANPSYWIAIGKNQEKADKDIYDKFYKYDWISETDLGKVIYLDQFTRHFSRIDKTISEEYIVACRKVACIIVKDLDLSAYSADNLVWLLMPFKHLGKYDFVFKSIFSVIHSSRDLVEYPLLCRFFQDTYRKAYREDTVCAELVLDEPKKPLAYDPGTICDFYPASYLSPTWHLPEAAGFAMPELAFDKTLAKGEMPAPGKGEMPAPGPKYIVSLSGGVDSMVMCAILKITGIPFVAAHIVYGNREASESELEFIKHYCQRLQIPLYTYKVQYLKRGHVDRDFYEEMTRDLRFYTYKSIGPIPVLLGHIQEDVVENIWTNFAKGTHLNNLAKMTHISSENGVTIIRPWLSISKDLIYKASEILAIPYLKNTTPSWSNRGKFREKFYKATHDQYGEAVDEIVLKVADTLKKQATLINKLLYEPIYKSWNEETKTIQVSTSVISELDAENWSQILTHICHVFLHISKPSIHSCRDFTNRLARTANNATFEMKKDLRIKLSKNPTTITLQMIVL